MAGLSEPNEPRDSGAYGIDGDGFIIYTTMEGGPYHVIRGNREAYERVLETGEVRIAMFEDTGPLIEPVYFAYLAVVESNYDTIVGGEREAA